METTDLLDSDDFAAGRWLSISGQRYVSVERQVTPRAAVIHKVRGKNSPRTIFAGNDCVVQVLPPNGTNQPLEMGILPRRARRRDDFTYTRAPEAPPGEHVVDHVAVVD